MLSACKHKGAKKGSSVNHMGKKTKPYPQPQQAPCVWGGECGSTQGAIKGPERVKHQCCWVEGLGQCGTAHVLLREGPKNMAWNLLSPSVKVNQAKCRDCPY